MHNNLTRVIIFTFNFHLCVNISDEHDPYLLQVPTKMTVKKLSGQTTITLEIFYCVGNSVWVVEGGLRDECALILAGAALCDQSRAGHSRP